MDPMGVRRFAAVWAIPALVMVVIVAPPPVLIGRLPDPLAVHWGLDGTPNGSMGFWTSLAFLGGLWAFVWLGLLVAGHRGVPSSPALTVVYFVGGLLAAVQISIVDRNLNAPDWQSAGHIEWWGVVLVVLAGVAAGAGGWFLGIGAGFTGTAAEPGAVPSAGLPEDDAGEWVGTATVWWPVVLAVAVLGTIPFLGGVLRWVPVVVAVLVGLFTAAVVEIDDGGVTVRFGWFGWPRRRIRLEEIARAEAMDVKAIAYGGWGYRTRPGVSALIVRNGDAIRVVCRDRRDLVVTVDDATVGAGVLNDMLRREGLFVGRQ